MLSFAAKYLRYAASLKLAIPLLVLTIVVTIAGSLQTDTDYYRTWWYLGLLGLNGASLLFITVLHIPSILKRKGRNALLGVITTHLGILVLIGGVIYGGYSGFRHQVKLIEGEATVVPGLPFVIQLEALQVEEYRQAEFPRMDVAALPKKKQESRLSLLKHGERWLSATASPGRPFKVEGITLLPSLNDIGWYFELLVIDTQGRDKTIPVRPWAPPLINLGGTRVMTHGVMPGGSPRAELFTIENEQMVSLGFVSPEQPLVIGGYGVSLGPVKRYTGLLVYNRPQEPVLVLGAVLMFAGLVWHFYFRHRDRRQEHGKGGNDA